MASTKTTAVIRRVLDDDYIHAQIGAAGAGLRDAYRRARHLPAEKAIQDKAVYDRIRQTAAGLTEASRRALGKPKPKPPRRHYGLLALVALATGAVVIWASKTYSRTHEDSDPARAGAPNITSSPTTTHPDSGA